MAKRQNVATQAISGRSSFVAEMQLVIPVGQLANQLGNRMRLVLAVAEIAHPAIPARFSNSHRAVRLGRINPDENLVAFLHGLPPVP
jgi:hypothetical protein